MLNNKLSSLSYYYFYFIKILVLIIRGITLQITIHTFHLQPLFPLQIHQYSHIQIHIHQKPVSTTNPSIFIISFYYDGTRYNLVGNDMIFNGFEKIIKWKLGANTYLLFLHSKHFYII
jgi:hypothetical protein